MNLAKQFEVKYLSDAIEFINSLDAKVKNKILYDITRAQY